MKSVRIFFILAIAGLLFSCGDDHTQAQTGDSLPGNASPSGPSFVRVDSAGISIELESSLSPTMELDSSAFFQYQDYARELYLMISDEPKDEFISWSKKAKRFNESLPVVENLRETKLGFVRSSIAFKSDPGITAAQIGGMPASIISFSGKPAGMDVEIFYKIAFVDAGEKLYTVTIWTLDDRKAEHLASIDRMILSFRKK